MNNDDSQPSPPTVDVAAIMQMSNEAFRKSMENGFRDSYVDITQEDYKKCSPDALKKICEWERFNNRPDTLSFHISDAASLVGVNPDTLLHAGGRGTITLLTPIPPSIYTLPFDKNTAGDTDVKLEMLSLSDFDCRSIATNGFTTQHDFKSGYIFPMSLQTCCIFPGYRNYEYMYETATWRTYSGNSPGAIHISKNQLFLTRLSLCQLLDDKLYVTPPSDTSGGVSTNRVSKTTNEEPWLIANPNDEAPKQDWYTPARYFARELIKADSSLLNKRDTLARNVCVELVEKGIKKRGGKLNFQPGTILKAFAKVILG